MREVAGQIPENSEALVSAIVRDVTGEKTDSIEHIKGIGMNNSVTIAHTAHERFVVRTNVESHLFRFQREAWCFAQLESTPVLTPKILGCGIISGHSYSVAPFIVGSKPIGDGIDQLRVWRTLGRYASFLNQVRPPEAGSAETAYFPMGWEQQVASDVGLVFKDSFWLDHGLLSADEQELIRNYLLECASINAPQGVCVFDLTIGNAVICDSDYDQIYLLDLEMANIAPVPLYQLACIAADRGPETEVTKTFLEGYGADGKELGRIASDLNRFILYRLMRAAAWARDRYPRLLEENIQRTQPVLEATLTFISHGTPSGP
jgi:hypothetical protein